MEKNRAFFSRRTGAEFVTEPKLGKDRGKKRNETPGEDSLPLQDLRVGGNHEARVKDVSLT